MQARTFLARAALAGLLAGACADASARDARSAILICIDTLRADRVGSYGYTANPTTPSLDALAERSLFFADVTAPAGWTKPSVPSFLTGLYPLQHGVYEGSSKDKLGATSDALPEEAHTLAEAFREAGRRTAAFVHNAQLRKGLGFEQGFEIYHDRAGDAREVCAAAQAWLEELGDGESFFLYLHLLDVHMPYPVPDAYAGRFVDEARTRPFRGDGWRELRDAFHDGRPEAAALDFEALNGLYDGALRYVDDELGAFFAFLDERGLSDETAICVLSDHGEELGERGYLGHGNGLSELLLRVPFFVYAPGLEPRRVEQPVRLVDAYPTLLAAAGVPLRHAVAGVDRIADPERDAPLFAEHKSRTRYEQSLRRGSDKALVVRHPPLEPADTAVTARPGERWEVELSGDASSGFVATQFKPRFDDGGDPVELKGFLEGGAEGGWRIAGIPLAVGDEVEIKLADGAVAQPLAVGLGVKVEGALVRGAFEVQELKHYPESAGVQLEIRGPVRRFAPGEEVDLAGLRARVDGKTKWKVGDFEAKPRLGLAVLREAAAGRAAGEVSKLRYDLASDPFELRPHGDVDELAAALEALSASLLDARRIEAGQAVRLGDDGLAELEALGYGGDE